MLLLRVGNLPCRRVFISSRWFFPLIPSCFTQLFWHGNEAKSCPCDELRPRAIVVRATALQKKHDAKVCVFLLSLLCCHPFWDECNFFDKKEEKTAA